MGRDHTIYATVAGYVRYYRNPRLHPDRKYIGVALAREGPWSKLPSPANAPTRRRLGMYAAPIKMTTTATATATATDAQARAFLASHESASTSTSASTDVPATPGPGPSRPPPVLRAGTYLEANFELGRAAEKKGVQVRPYDRGDRWLAWRKRAKKAKTAALDRAAKAATRAKTKAKAKQKARRVNSKSSSAAGAGGQRKK